MSFGNSIHRLTVGLGVCSAVALGANQIMAAAQESPPPLAQADVLTVKENPAPVTPAPEPKESQVEILIMQALDQKTDLQVQDMPIADAVKQLSQNTGIPIEIETGTFGFLPYGSQTKVTAAIKGEPLKECLRALVVPLGLQFIPTGDRVVIKPTAPLSRIPGRASWEEVALLERLYSNPWSKELADSLEFQFQDGPAESRQANREILYRLAGAVGAGPAARVLECACDQRGWIWVPRGKTVMILSKTRQVEEQLTRLVACQYTRMSLRDVLLDLARQTGVLLRMDPGVLKSLPPGMADQFTMTVENVSARQALELIAGETGLNYIIEPGGVRISANPRAPPASQNQADAAAQATVAALRANSIVGQVTLPSDDGSSFAFFIRENDLPNDVNELRKAMIHDAAEKIGQRLRTQPPAKR